MAARSGLLARLVHWAQEEPSKPLFRYLDERGRVKAEVTYEDAERRTRALATHIMQQETARLQPGDRVILVFLPSLEFILTFLACLRAGVIPVPVYPPNPHRVQQDLRAFTAITTSCGAVAALSHQEYYSARRLGALADAAKSMFRLSSSSGAQWPDIPWVLVDDWVLQDKSVPQGKDVQAVRLDEYEADPRTVAFLQYTSGSTAEPKGVMVTHGSLQHNLHTIVRALRASTETCVVSWLPQYHDMGLIGSLCGTLYCGGSGVYLSPLAFIQDPPLWLELIDRYRATHIQSPNFGYLLAARKWLARKGQPVREDGTRQVDLSSLVHMFNAAEPVTSLSVDTFLDLFEGAGLRRSAMAPGFGMAEHTVYVTDGGRLRLRVDREALEAGLLGRPYTPETPGTQAGKEDDEEDEGDHNATAAAAAASEPDPTGAARPRGVAHVRQWYEAYPAPGTSEPGEAQVWKYWGAPQEQDYGAKPPTHCPLPLQEAVGCGPVTKNDDIVLAIVDPDTQLAWYRSDTPRPSRCPDAVPVGELWVHSPSVTGGYWNKPELTQEMFHATIRGNAHFDETFEGAGGDHAGKDAEPMYPDESKSDEPHADADAGAGGGSSGVQRGWLRTGDLAFVWGGELFITGRLKEMMILRGRNYYPQDVEQTAEAVPAEHPSSSAAQTSGNLPTSVREGIVQGILRPGCSAALAVPSDVVNRALRTLGLLPEGSDEQQQQEDHDEVEEWLVVVGEYRMELLPSDKRERVDQLKRDALRVARAIQTQHGVAPAAVLFFHKRAVRKTTSGKIARMWNLRALRQLAAQDESGPWQKKNKTILFALPISPGALAPGLDADSGGQHAQAGAHADAGGGEPCPVAQEEKPTVTGDPLGGALRWELGAIVQVAPDRIPLSMEIRHIGLDSQGFAQFKGLLLREYAFEGLTEEAMFTPGFSIAWLVQNAAALREGETVAPEGEPTHTRTSNGREGGDPPAAGPPAPLVEPRQPSIRERYFPCCLCLP